MSDHRSRPGDARRSGRAAPADPAGDDPPALELHFELRADGCLYVMLGRNDVGVICQETARVGAPGWNWICLLHLAGGSDRAKFAATLQKAKDAMRSAVETWCEAAGLCMRPRRAKREVRAWRAET